MTAEQAKAEAKSRNIDLMCRHYSEPEEWAVVDSGTGSTWGWSQRSELDAWLDALSRLPAPTEPAPKEGEKVKYMGGGMIGFACLEDESAWFRLGRWQRPGMIPQSEPAPKEGEQEDEHPYPCGVMRLDSARARCLLESDHEGDCVWDDEPAKVEAGDGLPPLDEEYELEMARVKSFSTMPHGPLELKLRAESRERQLKASLLREKELRELLKLSLDEMNVECSDGCTCGDGWQHADKELVERIKAAVKGE